MILDFPASLIVKFLRIWVFFWALQIVGTSNNFVKKPKQFSEKKRAAAVAAAASDSEDSYSSSSHGRHGGAGKIHSFSPSTPPPTSGNFRAAKRRKGIPHRAPMGGLIIEFY